MKNSCIINQIALGNHFMNPFSYGSVVKEPYFFDRKEEVERIINTLTGGNNIVLYAPRRYGKTSLVMKAIKDLEKIGYICIYFDFMAVYSRESFIEAFSKALLKKQSNVQKALRIFAKFAKGVKASVSFDNNGIPEFSISYSEPVVSDYTIDSVIDLPEIMAKQDKRYIIVMDEFQDIDKFNGESFENLLRSKIQHHRHTNYIFLGSRTHILNDMFTNKNRPFYNSASVMCIKKLPNDETKIFLKKSFLNAGIAIDTATTNYLIEQSGAIPYYIQFLASEVWQYTVGSTKTASSDVVDFCTDKILEIKSDYYLELFDRQTAYQKKLLRSLTQDGNSIFSSDYRRRFRLSVPSTTQKAVAGLISAGIIEKIQNTHVYSDPFFKRFVLRLTA